MGYVLLPDEPKSGGYTLIPDGTTQGGWDASGKPINMSHPAKPVPTPYEATAKGQSFLQNLSSGAGGAAYGLGYVGPRSLLGIAQPGEVKDWKDSMAGLSSTAGGTLGQVLGYAAPAALVAPMVGASVPLATGTAAAEGALMPAESWGERGQNTLFSGLGGLLGQAGGNALASRSASNVADTAAEIALKRAQNATRDKLIDQSQSMGYNFTPSSVGASLKARIAEGISGKYKSQQLMGIKNQDVTDQAARDYLGLPRQTSLSDAVLENQRHDLAQPYRDVANLPVRNSQQASSSFNDWSPQINEVKPFDPASALEQLKQARFNSRMNWRFFNKEGNPDHYAAAVSNDELANGLESQIMQYATDNGSPDLVHQLQAARVAIAKNHTIDNAMTNGTNTDAVSLGNALNRGAKLDGEALKIAEFGRMFKDIARVPKSGDANPVTAMDALFASPSMSYGLLTGEPVIAAASALPTIARIGLRYGMAAKPIQRSFVRPDYSTSLFPRAAAGLLNSPVTRPLLQGSGIYGYGVEPFAQDTLDQSIGYKPQ